MGNQMRAKLRPRLLLLLPLLVSVCAGRAMGSANPAVPPALSSPPAVPAAAQAVSPFTIVGFLQKATLDQFDDPLSGGTMVVNDVTITVPRNAVVNMPAKFVTWVELFSLAPDPWWPARTGLALNDIPKPLTTYEITVYGNRVISGGTDQYIAGLIFVSQQTPNTGQGFINFIDYATGEMRVGGTPGDATSGARVILNDPLGRFGRVNSPDVRFAVDDKNPTVRSVTGYPMCVPRIDPAAAAAGSVPDDPLCPQVNRPKDANSGEFLSVFNMPPPPCSAFPPLATGAPAVAPPDCVLNPPAGSPDVTQQMPFEVGDYVTYSGTLAADTTRPECVPPAAVSVASPPKLNPNCEYISAWTVIADIAAFTTPGVMPAYVGVDVTLMGTGGIQLPTSPQEATARAKVIGFTTDPSAAVNIYGIDIDACTGKTEDRYWGTELVQQVAKKGRFQFQPNGGLFIPPVRQIRVVSRTLSGGAKPALIDPSNTFANGVIAGQYVAPMMLYIFPTNLEVSDPPVPLNLQDFPFLVQGSGPWPGFSTTALPAATPAFATGLTAGQFPVDPAPVVSQLTPWPGATPPIPPFCASGTAQPPVANAGANQTVVAGSTVQLDGSGSSDSNVPSDLPLTFFWIQTSGPSVTLSNSHSMTPTFTAPLLPGTLTFSLNVTNTKAVNSLTAATVTITVTASSALQVNAGNPQTVKAGAAVNLAGAVSDLSASLTWTQLSGPSVTLSGANSLTPSFTAPAAQILAPTDLVFQLTATSATGGTASATVTITVTPQADAIFVEAVYQTSRALLSITVTSTSSSAANPMTVSFSGQQIQLLYNPGLNAYTTFVVGIAPPKIVFVTSSLGGTAFRFVLVVP